MSSKKRHEKTTYTERYFNTLRPPRYRPDGSISSLDIDACFGRYWDVGVLTRPWNRATRRELARDTREVYAAFYGSPED